jgi:hypothetical protein
MLGGSRVAIAGYDFTPGTICKFGPVSLPIIYHSPNLLECISPPHPNGPVSVEVSNDNGKQFSRNGVLFHYIGSDPAKDSIAVPANSACWSNGERISLYSPVASNSFRDNGAV